MKYISKIRSFLKYNKKPSYQKLVLLLLKQGRTNTKKKHSVIQRRLSRKRKRNCIK